MWANVIDTVDFEKLEPNQIPDHLLGTFDTVSLEDFIDRDGPFAPSRRKFCEFLGVSESALSRWISEDRVPRAVQEICLLLAALRTLQRELVQREQNFRDSKIVKDGDLYMICDFEADDAGAVVGTVVARDIATIENARALVTARPSLRLLNAVTDVIDQRLESELPDKYVEHLKTLRSEIESIVAYAEDYEKWKKLGRPLTADDL